MKYQEVFDLLNHIISSRDFLKRNRGKCVNSKNQIRFMGGVDNCRDVFISYLYKCLLFFDEYD